MNTAKRYRYIVLLGGIILEHPQCSCVTTDQSNGYNVDTNRRCHLEVIFTSIFDARDPVLQKPLINHSDRGGFRREVE